MDIVQRMMAAGLSSYLVGGRLMVFGKMDDQRQDWIRRHSDEIMAALPVDVEVHLKALAVGLPVDHEWLKAFFTPEDLTLISLGEYLVGDLDQYREGLRQILETTRYSRRTPVAPVS